MPSASNLTWAVRECLEFSIFFTSNGTMRIFLLPAIPWQKVKILKKYFGLMMAVRLCVLLVSKNAPVYFNTFLLFCSKALLGEVCH